MIKHFKEGKAAINSAINELIEFGYVLRITHRNSKGWVEYYEYLVFEGPNLSIEYNNELKPSNQSSELVSENQKTGDQGEVNQKVENPPLVSNDLKIISDFELKKDIKDPPSFSPKITNIEGENPNLLILKPIA